MGLHGHEDHTTHPILSKHDELLNKLSERDMVFDIDFENGKFHIVEQCDGYFNTELTKEMSQELSELFAEIAATL